MLWRGGWEWLCLESQCVLSVVSAPTAEILCNIRGKPGLPEVANLCVWTARCCSPVVSSLQTVEDVTYSGKFVIS
jgi:hypothetical protein